MRNAQFKNSKRRIRKGSFDSGKQLNEPLHVIMALFFLRRLVLQTRMRSHPVGLDVWFFVRPFVYSHTSCERPAKALVRLRGCAGSPELSLVAYVISNKALSVLFSLSIKCCYIETILDQESYVQ